MMWHLLRFSYIWGIRFVGHRASLSCFYIYLKNRSSGNCDFDNILIPAANKHSAYSAIRVRCSIIYKRPLEFLTRIFLFFFFWRNSFHQLFIFTTFKWPVFGVLMGSYPKPKPQISCAWIYLQIKETHHLKKIRDPRKVESSPHGSKAIQN